MIAFALWAAVGKPQQGKVLNGRPLKSSPDPSGHGPHDSLDVATGLAHSV